MDDISDKISALLSSEDGMEKLKAAANSLLGAQASGETQPAPDLSMIMKAAKGLTAGADDSRVRLLLALKPHLSEERAKRVDKAVKILQLVRLAPLLTESGIL